MAEELAEIDLISRGRLITGWVRGAGSEQFFNNANPAYNREYFEEAHDFIIQAWTRPGPWRYEGKHFHYRHVNPWALPYQKPHPQMWIPGTLSPETIRWCAEQGHPYFGLGTALPATCDMWDLYADEALKYGYEAGSENFGYLLPTFVAETDEKAQELGQGFLFGGGQNTFSRVEHTLPPGYNSKEAIQKLAKQPQGSWLGISGEKMRGQTEDIEIDPAKVRAKLIPGYQRAQKNLQFMIGSPKTVIPKMKAVLTTLRPGSLIVFNVQGPVSNADRQTSMRLLAQEVMPALKEHADSIGLVDAITKVPGTTKSRTGVKRGPVVDRGPLKEFGLVS